MAAVTVRVKVCGTGRGTGEEPAMSVDPTGAPDVPPPPTDPWPTDASVSPGYPPPHPRAIR
ncbi:hypothetical protein GCM10027615_79600 [Plantactinospora veratri]